MERPSHCATPLIEGAIIKNYRRQFFAKAINKEFDEALGGEEHYIRRGGKEGQNGRIISRRRMG
ncbi:MAG: hypothetical protein QW836_09610 [Ignisphaera sp.]